MESFRPAHLCVIFALISVLLPGGSLPFDSRPLSLPVPNRSAHLKRQNGADPAELPPRQAEFDTLRTVGRYVFRYTNQTRRERSLTALRRDTMLATVACTHNADMFRRGFFQHVNPDGEHPRDRVARLHRRLIGGVGENLYEQTQIRKPPRALAKQIVEKWMGSLPHRKNILRPQFNHLGVCVLQRNDTLRATQVFAGVAAYTSLPLPHRIKRGSVLPISFSETFPPAANPVRYDFWDADRNHIVSGPYVLTDSLRIPDTTGTIWPRFYVLEPGRYSIQRGPKITVTSP